ncbi:MAG TPA: carbohydrate ABC transporter substrate-binding protein, partial [Microbacterium sp.]|nr:carbohydrate ABC transporter substrate-binding protein [Microbacterium sp.]
MARTTRTKTQRAIAIVSTLTVAGLALAACSGGSSDAGGESGETLKLWHFESETSAMGIAWTEA